MTKIAIIGAGSAVFSQQMIVDALSISGLESGEFALIDIDPVRLERSHELAELSVKKSGKKFSVRSSTKRNELLSGTDFVINTIEVSGLETVKFDFEIPKKFGVDACIGDTVGPGGLMKFLRTAPAWLEIVHDIERLAPNAVVMNYTNPMSALVLLASRATKMLASKLPVIGLCHSIQNTAEELETYMGIPHGELKYRCAGVNHLSWFFELTHNGQDVKPRLLEVANTPEIYEQDIIRFEMLKHFGAFPTESSGHFSEYVPYFRKRPDLLEKYTRPEYKGESGFYARNWPRWRQEHDAEVRDLIERERNGEDAIKLERSPEFASNIIEGMVFDRAQVIGGNVINTGLIDNLSQDGCVEVTCLVDRNGIQPTHFGKLPVQLAAIDAQHMAIHDLMASAVLEGNRDAAFHSLLLDPLSAAVCSPQEIRAMFEELALAERDHLPEFMRTG
jgi:alpha-galactosidase